MKNQNLNYFAIAKELNTENHKELKKNKLHFRGNFNSFSLISLDKETAEKGKPSKGEPKFKTKDDGIKALDELKINPLKKNLRHVPEKELQAWVINYAMNNGLKLPFGNNLFFLTSEMAFPKSEKGKVVNDILAIDNEGNLVVVELKPKRDNTVKKQVEHFAKIIEKHHDLFMNLVNILTDKKWNGIVKTMVVWPKLSSGNNPRDNAFPLVEEINYCEGYHFE